MVNAYQTVLLYACMGMIGAIGLFAFAFFACKPIRLLAIRLRNSGRLNMSLALLAIALLVAYGGTKPIPLTVFVDFELVLGENVTSATLNLDGYDWVVNSSTNCRAYADMEITVTSVSYAIGYTAGATYTIGLAGDNPYVVKNPYLTDANRWGITLTAVPNLDGWSDVLSVLDGEALWSNGFEDVQPGYDGWKETEGLEKHIAFKHGPDEADDASMVSLYENGTTSPATSGDKYLKLSTEDGMLCFTPAETNGDATVSRRIKPISGEAAIVDAMVMFTLTDIYDVPTMPFDMPLSCSGTTSGRRLSVNAKNGSMSRFSPGGFIHVVPRGLTFSIDNKLTMFCCAEENATNLFLLAGCEENGTLEGRMLRLEAADSGKSLPVPQPGTWSRVTIYAVNDKSPWGLGYEVYVDGIKVAADGTRVFRAWPETDERDSIVAMAVSGEGGLDNVAFYGPLRAVAIPQIPPQIKNVTAKQRYPWNGLVDITCEVMGIEEMSEYEFAVSAVLPDSGSTNKLSNIYVVQGGTNSANLAISADGNYRILWDAKADLGQIRYTNMVVSVTLRKPHEKVQLWEGGPCWATTNIGAEEPWEFGYYFWWGDTVGCKRENDAWVISDGSSVNFAFNESNTPTCNKDKATLQGEGWITMEGVLTPEYDAAHVQWGESWRMPTKQELNGLCVNCDWIGASMNGVNGFVIRGRDDYAVASIFLPCAGLGVETSLLNVGSYGYCWSSVPHTEESRCAYELLLYSGANGTPFIFRNYGLSVRPVQETSMTAPLIITAVEPVDSVPFLLDTYTGVHDSAGTETLAYSSQWDGDANATVTIEQDGVAIAEGLTGEGEYVWHASSGGTWVLTHTTYTNGIVGTVETATFNVPAPELTIDYDGGLYTGGNVTINGKIDGWTIYYTTDGSTPTAESTEYTGPFVLPAAATVKVFAVSNTGLTTSVCEKEYNVVERPRIENVTAKQRYPWNALVDIDYTVTGDTTGIGIVIYVQDLQNGRVYKPTKFTAMPLATAGRHRTTWDPVADGVSTISTNMIATVSLAYASETTPPTPSSDGLYCVIDLSGGADAAAYPVTYLGEMPSGGFNTDEYKTSKLVLRRIETGTFNMMQRGTNVSTSITRPYHIGVFEVTQRQWELVMGTRPSWFNNATCYATRPVERVSYNMIRGSSDGAGWPESSAVDGDSFLGRLQARTGINFDLPTDAQWEYACRAGTTTDFNNGKNLTWQDCDVNLNEVARYHHNDGYVNGSSSPGQDCTTANGTAKVGSYQPNAWGLYDMHGNTWEWCLDWYGTLAGGEDPKGPDSGSTRMLRGGGWSTIAQACCSACRTFNLFPSGKDYTLGFRLARTKGCDLPVQVFDELAAMAVHADDSTTFLLDTRRGVRGCEGVEALTYSSLWDGDDGATATITQDGVAIAEGLSGEGELEWSVQKAGAYVLTHTTYTNGVAGKVESVTFNVAAKDVSLSQVVVDCRDVTYSGTAFTPPIQSVTWGEKTLIDGMDYTLAYADNVNAGIATITLTGTNFYNGTYTTNFTIRTKALTEGMVGAIGNHPYTGKAQTPKPTVTDAERGVTLREGVEYTLSYANNTTIGEGIVTVTGKDNYTGSIARAFVIEPSVVSELEESLGGAGKVESDGEGGWIVMITNDIDAADLPIEIPDNIGNVTIDLNGHDLTGNGGALGESALPGEPAIRIVPGEGDGEPTVITIVNSGDDATVKGGEGSPAIEVAKDAQDGVRVNIGEGVTMQGGDDYTSAIIGDVGTNEGTIVEPSRVHIPGEGTVTTPKAWKSGQKVTWKAVAAKGSVFAHWEGAFVDSLGLSRNQLRNPSLQFAVPAGFDADAIHAVFIAVDDDRLGTLTLSQPGPLAPNVDVAGLSLVDDSESYVTASMSGLPTGLKFDAKTLVLTGKPTKPGVYTVKVTAKNASGYQWAENIVLRVSDIEDSRIGFDGLPETGAVGTAYAGKIVAGEFKSLSASGLPAGLKMDAKTGAVGGIPTKGGYYTVIVTAAYANKTKATATRLLTISPVAAAAEPKRTAYHPLTVVSAKVAEGTVTGTGVYAAGKKASISAKPAKGYVFAGWYRDPELTKPMTFASGDFRKASQSVIVPEVRYLFARFVGSTAADDPITGLVATAKSFRWCVGVSVPGGDGVTYMSASLPTVSASGLPSGVKFDAVRGCFTGVPTKAGEYSATVTVKNASKSTATLRATFKVEALPEWAQGTFDGHAGRVTLPDGEESGGQGLAALPNGSVTLTVDAKGKISGKLIDAGGTWALSATAYERVEGLDRENLGGLDNLEDLENLGDLGNQGRLDDLVFHATVIGKNGKKAITNEVTVAMDEAACAARPPYRRGVVSGWTAVGPSAAAAEDSRPPEWTAWQNLWKQEPWKTDAKEYAKAPKLVIDVGTRDACPYQGTIELKFGASGAVTAKCGKDSCATVLIPAEDGTFDVFCYFAPKGEAAYAAEISLMWDAVEKKFSVVEP